MQRARNISQRSAVIAAALAIALAALLVWLLFRKPETARSPVRVRDFQSFEITGIPLTVTTSSEAVWVGLADQMLVKLDPRDGSQLERTRLPFIPAQMLATSGDVWVGAVAGNLVARVDARNGEIVERIEIGTTPQAVAGDESGLFVSAFDDGRVVRLDPDTGEVGDAVFRSTEAFPSAIVSAYGSLWITDVVQDVVTRVPLQGGERSTVPVGDSPTDVIAAFDSIWVANFNERTVTRVASDSGEVSSTIAVGAKPGPMAVEAGFVWVLRPGADDFVLIDPDAGRWTGDVYEVGERPQDIAVGHGAVWIVTQDQMLTRVPIS